MPARKTTPDSTKPAPSPIPKFVPSHGRGALNYGGTPGNKGGTGRPASKVREAFLAALDGGPEALTKIIQSPQSRDADRIAAIAAAAKIGLPVQIESVPTTPLTPAERTKRLTQLITTKKPRPA